MSGYVFYTFQKPFTVDPELIQANATPFLSHFV
jgi:hypothetical protein